MIEEDGRKYHFQMAVDLSAWEQQNKGYEDNEEMVNEGLRISMAAGTPEESIAALLEYMGQSLGSDRVYIFEESEENVLIKNLESVREEDRIVYEYLEPQNIHSLVVSPLISEGKIIGFYGVDNPPEKFLEHITTLLRILGHFIVALLHRRNHVRRLEELCFQDQLTGIGNRHAMNECISAMKPEKSLGVLYCDVMGLKRVNDRKGHREGDKLLMRVSECLKKVFGEYALFRIGGDEFLILCEGIGEEELNDKIEEINVEMRKKDSLMALGHVWCAGNYEDIELLLKEADERMYEDKRARYAEMAGTTAK